MSDQQWIIYTDGACSGNPGPGGWGAIVASSSHVTELGGHSSSTTNNRMEVQAAIEALRFILANQKPLQSLEKVTLYTDSKYLIQAATSWIWGWRRNNWVTAQGDEVKNRDLFEELDGLVAPIRSKISWNYVPGHQGIAGNERVDTIAVQFVQESYSQDLYAGPLSGYVFDVWQQPALQDLQKNPSKKKEGSGKKALGYVAYIDFKLHHFTQWADCARVTQGRSGVRYKKYHSRQELEQILTEWSVSEDKRQQFLNQVGI